MAAHVLMKILKQLYNMAKSDIAAICLKPNVAVLEFLAVLMCPVFYHSDWEAQSCGVNG